MSPFDVFTLVVVGFSVLFALSRGFTTELLSLAAWGGAVVGVRIFFAPISGWMRNHVESPAGADFASLFLSFFGILIFLRFVATLVGNRIKRSSIGPLDRAIGMGFGAVRGLIVVSLIYAGGLLIIQREDMPDWVRSAHAEPLAAFGARAITSFVDKVHVRREARFQTDEEEDGYDVEDRQNLDAETRRLLRESEKRNGKTSI